MRSPESLQKIDREIAKYPPEQKQSAVMAALIVAQDEKCWLATETMDFVARYLGMAPVAVYEVASFYNMYKLAPTGTHKLTVCTCLPCGLQGSLEAADYLKKKLGIGFGETTAEGWFTLKEGECMARSAGRSDRPTTASVTSHCSRSKPSTSTRPSSFATASTSTT